MKGCPRHGKQDMRVGIRFKQMIKSDHVEGTEVWECHVIIGTTNERCGYTEPLVARIMADGRLVRQ